MISGIAICAGSKGELHPALNLSNLSVAPAVLDDLRTFALSPPNSSGERQTSTRPVFLALGLRVDRGHIHTGAHTHGGGHGHFAQVNTFARCWLGFVQSFDQRAQIADELV